MTNLNFFFYGTLMTREGRDSCMAGLAEPRSVAVAPGHTLWDVGCFPAMLPGDSHVTGELWTAVSEDAMPELLRILDRIEGYDPDDRPRSMYVREEVTLADGTVAQTYIWNGRTDYLRRIPGDDWKAYTGAPEEVIA